MALDLKYGRVTLEHSTIGEDEPVVVFRGQDKLVPLVLKFYRDLCEHSGSPERHLVTIERARAVVEAWQKGNLTKTPSSDSMAGLFEQTAAPRQRHKYEDD